MQQAGLSFISPLIAPDEGLEEYATSMALDDWSGEEETDPSAIKRLLVQVSSFQSFDSSRSFDSR